MFPSRDNNEAMQQMRVALPWAVWARAVAADAGQPLEEEVW
jgi:hypothetical protein